MIWRGRDHINDNVGFSVDEIEAAIIAENKMQENDSKIIRLQASRNNLEAFIFEMRGAPRRKYGELIDADQLNKLMDECENWLWDNYEASLENNDFS